MSLVSFMKSMLDDLIFSTYRIFPTYNCSFDQLEQIKSNCVEGGKEGSEGIWNENGLDGDRVKKVRMVYNWRMMGNAGKWRKGAVVVCQC